MDVKVGQRLHSAVCDAQVVVVKAPGGELDVRCGGQPMVADPDGAPGGSLDTSIGEPAQLGKRYAAEDLGVELLCTRGGAGALSIGEQPVRLKGATPLPSSD